jgi:hypothetical protein
VECLTCNRDHLEARGEVRQHGAGVNGRSLRNVPPIFGDICPLPTVTRTVPSAYVVCMFATLLVIGGVLLGLFLLLALIVSLSARPATRTRVSTPARTTSWMADSGRRHPDAWSASTSEMPAVR